MPGSGGVSLPLQCPLAEIIEIFWTMKMLAAQAPTLKCLQSRSWAAKKSPVPVHGYSSHAEGWIEKLQESSYLQGKISKGTKFHVTLSRGKLAQSELLETGNVTSGDTNLPCLKCYQGLSSQPNPSEPQQLQHYEKGKEVAKTEVRTARVASPSQDRVALLVPPGFLLKLEKQHKFMNSIQPF